MQKNAKGVSIFTMAKSKKNTEILVEIMSILTKHCPRAFPKPRLHTILPATLARDALANTALTGKMLSQKKKRTLSSFKIQDFSSQIKVAKVMTASRKSLKDEILQKACASLQNQESCELANLPPASKSWSNFSEVKWQWQSTSAMALRGTQAPPSAKTHVLVDGSWCFGTAKLLLLNTGLVLLSSLWVDFRNMILNFWVCTYMYPPFRFCWFACRKSITCVAWTLDLGLYPTLSQ